MNSKINPLTPLNFAIIGAGKFGRNYIRLFQTIPNISLKAVVTRSSSNLQEVMEDPLINCVIIATPPAIHFEIAKLAITHKKHVLVEKPMVVNLKEARTLKKAAENSDRIFMVGFQYLFNGYIQYLKKEIENGSFGTIQELKIEHLLSSKRKDVNCFWDIAPHALSIFQFFFNPTKIIEIKGSLKHSEAESQEDYAEAAITFDHGPILKIIISWLGEEKTRKITLSGDKKTALLDETKSENKLVLYKNDGTQFIPSIAAGEPLKNELKCFIDSVQQNKTPLNNVQFGYLNTKWLEEISNNLQKNINP